MYSLYQFKIILTLLIIFHKGGLNLMVKIHLKPIRNYMTALYNFILFFLKKAFDSLKIKPQPFGLKQKCFYLIFKDCVGLKKREGNRKRVMWDTTQCFPKTQEYPGTLPLSLMICCSHSAVFLFSPQSLHMWQLSKVDHRPSGIFRGVTCKFSSTGNTMLSPAHIIKDTIECRT